MSKSYIDPTTVLSPKGSVKNLEVLHDGGARSFSLAKMIWEGREAYGFRWNGYTDTTTNKMHKGSPISTGHPVWMILPNEMVQALDFDKIINCQSLNQKIVSAIKSKVAKNRAKNPEGFALSYEAEETNIQDSIVEDIKEALKEDSINVISIKEKETTTLFNIAYT